MMKKIILAAAGMVFATSSFADLVLVNNTSINPINVTCTSQNIQAIPLKVGSTDIPWVLLYLKFKSLAFPCTFYDAQNNKIVTAQLEIASGFGSGAISYPASIPGYSIKSTANQGSAITVTIAQATK